MKTIIGIGALVAVLATSGCLWPYYGRHGHRDHWSQRDEARRGDHRDGDRDRGRNHDHDNDRDRDR